MNCKIMNYLTISSCTMVFINYAKKKRTFFFNILNDYINMKAKLNLRILSWILYVNKRYWYLTLLFRLLKLLSKLIQLFYCLLLIIYYIILKNTIYALYFHAIIRPALSWNTLSFNWLFFNDSSSIGLALT